MSAFISHTPADYTFAMPSSSGGPIDYSAELSQTRKAESARRLAAERRQQVLVEVVAMEVQMGIAVRWQPSDSQYMATVKYISERHYHRALDRLQKLVVLRLFELNKLNLAGTGKHIARHCKVNLQIFHIQDTRCARTLQNHFRLDVRPSKRRSRLTTKPL